MNIIDLIFTSASSIARTFSTSEKYNHKLTLPRLSNDRRDLPSLSRSRDTEAFQSSSWEKQCLIFVLLRIRIQNASPSPHVSSPPVPHPATSDEFCPRPRGPPHGTSTHGRRRHTSRAGPKHFTPSANLPPPVPGSLVSFLHFLLRLLRLLCRLSICAFSSNRYFSSTRDNPI